MCARRLLTLSPDNEPMWVRLYIHEIEGVWAAMLVVFVCRWPPVVQD